MSHNITVEGGTSVRLATAGKYCDRDIVVTATGGGSIWDEEIPDDGKTRLFIHLPDGRTSPMLRCYVNGTVTVDWGDGTDPDTLTGTSTGRLVCTPNHEYAESGDYIITLTVSGTVAFGGTTNVAYIMGAAQTYTPVDYVYGTVIKKIIIGDSVTLSQYALNAIGGLVSMTIQEGFKSLPLYGVANNYALANVTLPASLLGIGNYTFANCPGVRYYDFTACTSVPALVAGTVFTGLSPDCEIRVPSALYDEWIAATNWSSYADYIVAV